MQRGGEREGGGLPGWGPQGFLIQGVCRPACTRLARGEAILPLSISEEGPRSVFPESFAISLWDEVWRDEKKTGFGNSRSEWESRLQRCLLVWLWVLIIFLEALSLSL